MKAMHLLAVVAGFHFGCCSLLADLEWHSGGSPITQLVLSPGESATVQLYCDNPTARSYDVTMGNSSNSTTAIESVLPLFLAGNWVLESTPTLAGTSGGWVTVPFLCQTNTAEAFVTDPVVTNTRLYRLRKPGT